MTREEIMERAAILQLALHNEGMTVEWDTGIWTEMVENHLLSLVRAALEEAARAVCDLCRGGDYPLRDRREWLHFDGHGDDFSCNATEIHDLIAKLDKEGEDEL